MVPRVPLLLTIALNFHGQSSRAGEEKGGGSGARNMHVVSFIVDVVVAKLPPRHLYPLGLGFGLGYP